MIDEITRGKGKEDEMPNDILFSIYYDVVQQNELCSKSEAQTSYRHILLSCPKLCFVLSFIFLPYNTRTEHSTTKLTDDGDLFHASITRMCA